MAVCWVILRGQQIYTVIQAVHTLLYIVAKCHFFSVVTWKDIIKYLQKYEGCTHFCEILYINSHTYIYTVYSVHIYLHTHTHTHARTHAHTHTHTHTGHFIMYILLVPGWTPFAFRTALILRGIDSTRCWKHSSGFCPYWHDNITQLLQICRLHIHDVNLPFHHITKMLYWIEIWWLWRSFE